LHTRSNNFSLVGPSHQLLIRKYDQEGAENGAGGIREQKRGFWWSKKVEAAEPASLRAEVIESIGGPGRCLKVVSYQSFISKVRANSGV
jgi:hypothetical protein